MTETIYYMYANDNLVKRTGSPEIVIEAMKYANEHRGYTIKVFAERYRSNDMNKRDRAFIGKYHYAHDGVQKSSRHY